MVRDSRAMREDRRGSRPSDEREGCRPRRSSSGASTRSRPRRPRHVLRGCRPRPLQRRRGRRSRRRARARTLVLLNYPLALGAIALAAVAGGPRPLVWAAIVLCASPPCRASSTRTTWTPAGSTRPGGGGRARARADDRALRAAARRLRAARARRPAPARARRRPAGPGAALARRELGFYFPGDFFMGEEVPETRDPGARGRPPRLPPRPGRRCARAHGAARSRDRPLAPLAAYLSLMLAYGLANASRTAGTSSSGSAGRSTRSSRACSGRSRRGAGSRSSPERPLVYMLWFRPGRQR